ncbi:MAG: hypothetical protein JNL13_07640 [Chitinophagaceae bacterium]|nr:hypothetical protein [Chitinophagaceae bacterium]
MMNRKSIFSSLSFLFFTYGAQAQTSVSGDNPADIHWKAIQSKAVKVIFPEGNTAEAQRVSNIINYIHDSAGVTIGSKRKHLNLLLQTNQVVSNGYVALAPFRSEFYATGFQNFNILGSMNWIDGLSFHEYRHALQFANSRRGFTKFLSIIGGQQMWALGTVFAMPNWYMEGDAVQTETLFSGSGRGRTPYFFKEQRALLLDNRDYKYIKARNGSFKDLLPNHYPLGYALLRQMRDEHGPDVWAKVMRDASSYRSVLYPFSRAMKRHTGLTSRKAYYHTYASLKKEWSDELKEIKLVPTTPVTKLPRKTVTSYQWAHQLEDGSIICRKESYKRTGEIVHIKDGKEKPVAVLGIGVNETFLSVNNGRIAWNEFTTDKRWQNRNYSVIRTYDLNTHSKRRLTAKTKLFAPEFSNSGNKLVAVRANEHIRNMIVFLDAGSGNAVDSLLNPQNDFISYPHWTKDDAAIVYLAKREGKIAMLKYDLNTRQVTELTPWSRQVIGPMTIGKQYVYFTASYTGINNIFAVSLKGDKQIRQLSSVKVAAGMPSVSADEKTMVLSEFTHLGDQLTRQAIDPASAPVYSITEPEDQAFYKVRTTAVEHKLYSNIPKHEYPVKDYKGLIRSPQLHSWAISGSQSDVHLKISINNILNDFGAEITGGYNINERALYASGRVDYARYYLPVSLQAAINERRILSPTNLADTGATSADTLNFTENIYTAALSLPLKWKHGIYHSGLTLNAGISQVITNKYKLNDVSVPAISDKNFTALEAGLQFFNYRDKAHQNFNPRFGQDLTAYLGSSLSNTTALKLMAQANLYFPGFARNHSFYLRGGYLKEELANNYRFMDNFNHARGYRPMRGDEEYVAGANYQLPLFYPDWGFGGLLYFQRIRLNVFADFSQVKNNALNRTFDQNSFGYELLFDVTALNALRLSAGVRNSFLQNRNFFDADRKNVVEFYFAGTF